MTRPKDMIPGMFCDKNDEWPQWKESVEDCVEKIRPGMKELLKRCGKAKEEIAEDRVQKVEGYVKGQWLLRMEVFSLLETRTVAAS